MLNIAHTKGNTYSKVKTTSRSDKPGTGTTRFTFTLDDKNIAPR